MTFPDDGGVNWIAINIGFREEVGWLPVGSEAAWRRVARRTRRRTVARRRRRRRRWDWNNFVSTKLTQTRSHSDGQAGTTVQHLNCCRHCQEPWPQKVPSTCMAFILHIIDLEANLFIFPDSYFSSNLPSSSSLVSLVTTWYTRLIMSWERALVLLDWKTPRNCFVDFIVHCRFFLNMKFYSWPFGNISILILIIHPSLAIGYVYILGYFKFSIGWWVTPLLLRCAPPYQMKTPFRSANEDKTFCCQCESWFLDYSVLCDQWKNFLI